MQVRYYKPYLFYLPNGAIEYWVVVVAQLVEQSLRMELRIFKNMETYSQNCGTDWAHFSVTRWLAYLPIFGHLQQ